MREFKTFNFNKNWMQITIMIPILFIIPIAALSDHLCNRPNSILSICLNLSQDDLNFLYLVLTILFFLLFIYSFLRIFNYTVITYDAIENRMAFPSITLSKKSWSEIKHYAHVTETFSGRYRDDIVKAIWFIDFNDKVCFRLTKWGSFNFKKLIEKVNKYEYKFEIELEYNNPYQTLNGWKKVDYLKKQKIKPKKTT